MWTVGRSQQLRGRGRSLGSWLSRPSHASSTQPGRRPLRWRDEGWKRATLTCRNTEAATHSGPTPRPNLAASQHIVRRRWRPELHIKEDLALISPHVAWGAAAATPVLSCNGATFVRCFQFQSQRRIAGWRGKMIAGGTRYDYLKQPPVHISLFSFKFRKMSNLTVKWCRTLHARLQIKSRS